MKTLTQIALLSLLAACANAGDSSLAGGGDDRASVRDSSGIEIVEHSAARVAALPVLTIDTAPVVRLRQSADEGFTNPGDMIELPDGRLL